VGAVLFFLIGFLLHTPGGERKPQRGGTDWVGLALIALCLGCLQVVMDRGQEDDWFASGMITSLSLISASALILLIWWEVPQESPMVDLTLFKRRDFAIGFVLMLFFGFMILGTTYLLPAYAQNVMGYRATEAGEILAPGGLLLVVLFPVVGQMVNKVDLRLLIGFGIAASSFAIWWMTNFYLEISMGTIAKGRVMQAVGLACLFLPINFLAFRDLPRDRTNYASALINLARNFGGSIGISTASTLVTRRQQFHQTRMVEHLQPLNPDYNSFIDHISQATHAAPGSMQPFARAARAAMEQILLLSYVDAFKFFAIVFLSLSPLLLFVKPGTGTSARHGGE
jgi:DHA2 family multidrug resistance protein